MLKKTEKSFDNIYGIKKIDDNYLFNRPCLLTFPPSIGNVTAPNGYLNNLLYILRMRTSKFDGDYSIDDVPFDIFAYESKEKVSDKIINIIPTNDVEKAKKVLHNINIFSYCNGNNRAATVINRIYSYLKKSDYTEDDIKDIMSQVFVIQTVDNYSDNDEIIPIPYVTGVVIQDIYDSGNLNHVEDFNSDNPFISTMTIDKTKYYLYKSFGENSLYETGRDHIFKNDYIDAPIVNSVIALNIIKAISSSLNNTPRSEITIYNELKEIINKSQDYIGKRNIEDLTKDEKNEMNNILFNYVKKTFIDNIDVKKLSDNEKKNLDEKEKAIQDLKVSDILNRYNIIVNEIDEIIDLYLNHSYGEVIDNVSVGSNVINVTREYSINLKLKSLEEKIYFLNDIIVPDNLSSKIKNEFIEFLKSLSIFLKEKINCDIFQNIINEVCTKNTILKKIN